MKTLIQAYLDVSMKIPIEDVKVLQRLDRAESLLKSYGYSVNEVGVDTAGNTLYHIFKASTTLLEDTSVQYEVTVQHCTCPDYPSARGNLCKHRLAIMLKEEMNL